MTTDREQIGHLIFQKVCLHSNFDWLNSGKIKHLIIDNLLPESLALEIYRTFPDHKDMELRQGLQERKFTALCATNWYSSSSEKNNFGVVGWSIRGPLLTTVGLLSNYFSVKTS